MLRQLTIVLGFSSLVACSHFSTIDVPNVEPLASAQWLHDEEALPSIDLALSPDLKNLVDEALGESFSLAAARSRMLAADRFAVVSGGRRWPSFSAAVTDSGSKNDILTLEQVTANLEFSWEIDVWGRLAATASAAEFAALQQQVNFGQTRNTLAADVIKTYLDGIEARAQLYLAEQRVDNLRENLSIIRDGFNSGSGVRDAFDLYSAQAELMANIATFKQRKLAVDAQVRRLALLLGRAEPESVVFPPNFPNIQAIIPASLDSSIILRRPDMKAAEFLLRQQHKNLGVAKANRLPVFNITGSTGKASAKLRDVLSDGVSTWRLLGGITTPLFRGGELRAEQQRQQLLLEAEIASYQQTALAAFSNIERGLVSEQLLNEQERAIHESVRVSTLAEERAREQYIGGLSDVNTWLQSQRTAFDRQSSLLQIQTTVLKNRVDLYIALGGEFKGVSE